MTINVIDPRVDAYGTHARAGALADYVEAQALLGRKVRQADIADIADEQGWSRKSRRTIIVSEADLEDDPASWGELAFGQLQERADILAGLYPFRLVAGALEYVGDSDVDDEYVALLAISVVHGWQFASPVQPTVVLEDVVRRALVGMSLTATDMGTGDRSGLSFVDNLAQGGRLCGLSPTDSPVPREASAKDAGVDTLASLPWRDRRQGQWVFIGQVTCGSSLTWKRKMKEPEAARWRDYLQERLLPQTFLAVPHHVDERYWAELMVSQHGLILDRLRLRLSKGPNSDEEKALIQVLLLASPE